MSAPSSPPMIASPHQANATSHINCPASPEDNLRRWRRCRQRASREYFLGRAGLCGRASAQIPRGPCHLESVSRGWGWPRSCLVGGGRTGHGDYPWRSTHGSARRSSGQRPRDCRGRHSVRRRVKSGTGVSGEARVENPHEFSLRMWAISGGSVSRAMSKGLVCRIMIDKDA